MTQSCLSAVVPRWIATSLSCSRWVVCPGPPEPMVKILAAAEEMQSGQVLAGLLGREPVFLFPELAKRGHAWRGGFDPDGTTYRVLVRVGRQGHEQ